MRRRRSRLRSASRGLKFQSFKVSKFQSFKVSKFQSFKVSKFQSFKVSKFQSFKVSGFTFQVMKNDEVIRHFEADSLPGDGFHHADHVRLAFAYLCEYPPLEALAKFSVALKRFAAARGKPNLYNEDDYARICISDPGTDGALPRLRLG